ncbi:uncharacterized protein K460DRAFT_15127 [Cucurbitaria berberidis CBS 394.84]|uniref:Transmembrane protein n=1 Tax=Cucurbitaria berberidis CBS 394.84 TaxID=1168544 RepID=A0A9P4GPP8_9PLEO|nr:uncharacterized protein K460DRAFT_15127 [Cucurbitaria berberidis CBS 394.84]KAF1850398.1 hypothetical protein K460DRAFT_15127 [Cucurbitaria berberidis CBS 394.84]
MDKRQTFLTVSCSGRFPANSETHLSMPFPLPATLHATHPCRLDDSTPLRRQGRSLSNLLRGNRSGSVDYLFANGRRLGRIIRMSAGCNARGFKAASSIAWTACLTILLVLYFMVQQQPMALGNDDGTETV